jgi:hypothetical protein
MPNLEEWLVSIKQFMQLMINTPLMYLEPAKAEEMMKDMGFSTVMCSWYVTIRYERWN